ncbi:MAG TPA: PepSY-like domain-containing protein [Moheibacter sp.]|nr:PepSY-like domain-containing protein [Moheibacter sp.]
MKNLKLIQNAFLGVLLTAAVFAFGQDKIVAYSELPQSIQSYISQHFPKHQVLQSEMENKLNSKEYEIVLSGNVKLEFDKNNQIKSIDAKSRLPESVIPAKIAAYVKTNYPNNFMKEWELKKNKQKVELDNGLELEFSLNGDFLKIDK